MAFDAFVLFPSASNGGRTDIEGESTDSVFGNVKLEGKPGGKKAIEIKEFSFGAETTLNITSANLGAGAGKATFKEFKIKKQIDTASPKLLQIMGTGDHYSLVNLYIRKSGAATGAGKSGKAGAPYLVFAFGMVAVKSVEWSGADGDDVPTEEVTFEFGELVVGYYPQQKDGTLGALCPGSWSKLHNSTDTEMVKTNDVTNQIK